MKGQMSLILNAEIYYAAQKNTSFIKVFFFKIKLKASIKDHYQINT